MNIFVGTAGFSYKDWEGVVYPDDLKKRKIHPLEYLAQFFDCCEINTSFYGHIRPNGKKLVREDGSREPEFSVHSQALSGIYAHSARRKITFTLPTHRESQR